MTAEAYSALDGLCYGDLSPETLEALADQLLREHEDLRPTVPGDEFDGDEPDNAVGWFPD